MHLSRMRPAPEFARGQLAAGIGAERTANAANNETGGCHGGITTSLARICGMRGPAGVGAERAANAANNETGGCHGGITELFARICGTVVLPDSASPA
jgi:hypothetical protein